jgi:hypothetical protein
MRARGLPFVCPLGLKTSVVHEMQKIFCVMVLLLFLGSVAGGCIGQNTDFTLRIAPPQEQQPPLRGTWQIVSLLKEGTSGSPELAEQWVGKTLHFVDKKVLLGGYLLPGFRYQAKRVESEDYLHYQQQAFPADFRFKNKEIEVITLSDDYLFLCEFVRENDDELLLILFNTGYLVRKISDDVDEAILTAAETYDDLDIDSLGEQGSKYTGLLLGLCTSGRDLSSRESDHYRTLWLALENRKLAPVLETEAIIFPRKKGFYQLKVAEKSGEEKGGDLLIAVNMADTAAMPEEEKEDFEISEDPQRDGGGEGNLHRRVNYIGNDYLSIEETVEPILAGGGESKVSRLYTVAIDDLPWLKAVKISDLAGAGAARTMEQGKLNLLRQLGLEHMDQPGQLDEENFGLARKMGYWTFNGRLNYPKGGTIVSADYHIDVIPPGHVVFYNKLNIPWPRVKNYVPGALDVFTSPNMDLALVITKNEILIYSMFQGNLAAPPLERIPLEAGEKVIMAEWALGQYYVENWAMTFETYLGDN